MQPLIWRMGCTLGGGGGQEQTGEMQPLIWRRGCTLGGGGGGLSGVKLVQQLTGGSTQVLQPAQLMARRLCCSLSKLSIFQFSIFLMFSAQLSH